MEIEKELDGKFQRHNSRRSIFSFWPIWGLILGIALSLLWSEVLMDRLIPKRWGVVERGHIYRCGQLTAPLVKRTLEKNKIDVIINLTSWEPDDPDQEAEVKAADELGIDLKRFPLSGDGTGAVSNYIAALTEVYKDRVSGKTVLVHCAAGTQRTGGIIATYRLLVKGDRPRSVFREMQRFGYDEQDNPALKAYLNSNMTAIAQGLASNRVIFEIPKPIPVLK